MNQMKFEFTDNENGIIKAKFSNWVSLIILWVGIIFNMAIDFEFSPKFILGLIFLSIATIATWVNYYLGAKSTFVFIILGIFNIVKYWPSLLTLNLEFSGFIIYIEAPILIVGFIHYFTNRKVLSVLINKELSEEELEVENRKTINGYKNSFSDKDVEELRTIANNNTLIPQAIIAAKELIEIQSDEEDRNT